MVISLRAVQLLKALLFGMLVALCGMVIAVSALQPLNVAAPITPTLFGQVMLVSFAQSKNIYEVLAITEFSPKAALVRLVQPRKILVPIVASGKADA